jgi:hypothetical protein
VDVKEYIPSQHTPVLANLPPQTTNEKQPETNVLPVSNLPFYHNSNIFHKNREISILTIKKKTARLTLPQEATERTKQGETKNKTKNEKHTPRYEQKCQSHTCSETINSSMYDSDLTITTSPLTSSAPYSG